MHTFNICLGLLVAIIAIGAIGAATLMPEMGVAARLAFSGVLVATALALHYTAWRALEAAPKAEIQASSPVFAHAMFYALVAGAAIAAIGLLINGRIFAGVAVLILGVIPWSVLAFWLHTRGLATD